MLIELAAVLGSAGLAYFARDYYAKWQRQPNHKRVLTVIEQFAQRYTLPEQLSEAEIELQLAQVLAKRFEEVNTQFLLSNSRHSRERIDIDLGNGCFGIELKKAQSLRRSNERNRLLGQVDMYYNRGYHSENFLVVLAGKAVLEAHPAIVEIKELLKQKKTRFFYLKTQ